VNDIAMNDVSSVGDNIYNKLDNIDEMFINGKINNSSQNTPNNNISSKPFNSSDPDSDGLNNDIENFAGTDPYLEDTDEDGLSDYQEMMIYNTNPLEKDTDLDGVEDGEELKLGTDPKK
jgi:hypothetical protein